MPEVLMFVHTSVEHPVVERVFFFLQSSTSDFSGHRLHRDGRSSASPRESMTRMRTHFTMKSFMLPLFCTHVQIDVKHCQKQLRLFEYSYHR